MRGHFFFCLISAAALGAPNPGAIDILHRKCGGCHGAAAMSGLDLRTRESALKGGKRGPSLAPGSKEKSLIYEAVVGSGSLKMPPGKDALTPEETATLGRWIEEGAKWVESSRPPASTPAWWSFRKPERPPVPSVKNENLVQNSIDAFILARIEAKGLTPVPQAARDALLRRAYMDLHGLPPTPEEAAAFMKDESPDAFARLVDKLLASSRYGERWGRHWLDVVRYADTGGHENDIYLVNAWRYRDYVIDSFNQDKPYNIFVQEQIAADEIWPNNLDHDGTYLVSKEKRIDFQRRIGTGLYTVGPVLPASALNPAQFRSEQLADWADVTGAAFLGMTFGCARCHDHKFDPIPQRDYYRLQAVFAASDVVEVPTVPPATVFEFRNDYTKQLVVDDLKQALDRLTQRVRDRLSEARRKQPPAETVEADVKRIQRQSYTALARQFNAEERTLRDKLLIEIGKATLEAPKPVPTADVLGHLERPTDVHVEVRGEWKDLGDKVTPGLPSALGGGDVDDPESYAGVSQRRKQLALWLTNPEHPLTARVMVNRVWQWHFGWGLVRTSNDFGRQGEAPDNPQLLDWLTTEFVNSGWSLKRLHKLILLSSTWQRSTASDAKCVEVDPENRLLWRMNPRRLEAEVVRDAILSVSGSLNLKAGGPPVLIPLNEEEMASVKGGVDRWPATTDPDAPNRRSVYLFQKRLFRIPFLEVFDLPDSAMSCARRSTTNVAPQALALLNHPFMLEQARKFARRLLSESSDPRTQVETAWSLALARRPSEGETRRALELMGASGPDVVPNETQLAQLCLTIFNMNEFIYLD
jgi:hypothetical protein